MKARSYSELKRLRTFEERFEYLNLLGEVGAQTFGFDRWVNQEFYRSKQWEDARQATILRDAGCDLGVPGYEIQVRLMIHHINPLTPDDIREGRDVLIDPENLIVCSHRTHNAIHFGDRRTAGYSQPVERKPGDTRLW